MATSDQQVIHKTANAKPVAKVANIEQNEIFDRHKDSFERIVQVMNKNARRYGTTSELEPINKYTPLILTSSRPRETIKTKGLDNPSFKKIFITLCILTLANLFLIDLTNLSKSIGFMAKDNQFDTNHYILIAASSPAPDPRRSSGKPPTNGSIFGKRSLYSSLPLPGRAHYERHSLGQTNKLDESNAQQQSSGDSKSEIDGSNLKQSSKIIIYKDLITRAIEDFMAKNIEGKSIFANH